MLSLDQMFRVVDDSIATIKNSATTTDTARVTFAADVFLSFDAMRMHHGPFDRGQFVHLVTEACDRAVTKQSDTGGQARCSEADRVSDVLDYPSFVGELYARCWRDYSSREYEYTVRLFLDRLEMNGAVIDLSGGRAADIGCGSARNAVALVRLGAREVVGVDFSKSAIDDARVRLSTLPEGPRISLQVGSAIDLASDWTDSFDFVVSNGVVHHTPDPIAGVQEIARVCRSGAMAFFMVYGSGGLFWGLTSRLRDLVRSVDVNLAHETLVEMGINVHKRFFCLDHWFTTYQEQITRTEFELRLRQSGFESLRYLSRGAPHDAVERLARYPEEADLIGDPDMRYLVRKI